MDGPAADGALALRGNSGSSALRVVAATALALAPPALLNGIAEQLAIFTGNSLGGGPEDPLEEQLCSHGKTEHEYCDRCLEISTTGGGTDGGTDGGASCTAATASRTGLRMLDTALFACGDAPMRVDLRRKQINALGPAAVRLLGRGLLASSDRHSSSSSSNTTNSSSNTANSSSNNSNINSTGSGGSSGGGGGGGVGGDGGGVGGGDSGGCPGGLVWGGAAVVEGAAVVRLDLTGTQEKSHRLLLGKEDSLADYIRSNERAFDARGL